MNPKQIACKAKLLAYWKANIPIIKSKNRENNITSGSVS